MQIPRTLLIHLVDTDLMGSHSRCLRHDSQHRSISSRKRNTELQSLNTVLHRSILRNCSFRTKLRFHSTSRKYSTERLQNPKYNTEARQNRNESMESHRNKTGSAGLRKISLPVLHGRKFRKVRNSMMLEATMPRI